MKPIFITLLFLISSVYLQAQNEADDYRIVYLHDGSVLKGTLLPSPSPSDSIHIQIAGGKQLFITNPHIAKIVQPKGSHQYIGEGRSIKTKGRFYALHTHLLSNYQIPSRENTNIDSRLNLGIHFVMGHKFSEKAALGIGLGLDKYPSQTILPIFIDFRGVLDHNHHTLAFAYNIMAGYGIHTGISNPTEEGQKRFGGIMIYPNIGMRIARKKMSNIFIDIGYKFQHDKYEYSTNDWWWWGGPSFYTERRWYKSIALRCGWEF